MAHIRVRALPDRIVYDAPRGGKRIPSDKFVQVQDSHWIQRLINHWGDVEVEGIKAKAEPPKAAAVKPSTEAPKT